MATINYLTRIEFDFGSTKLLPDLVKELGIKKPLIVTDPHLAKSDILKKLTELIQHTGPALFPNTPQNPTEEAVESAVKIYQANGCDGVIAVGGGSSIDLAKGVALLATHDGPLEQYAVILGGLNKITSKVAPVIAIPTTAGTGSEVGRGALISLNDGRKLGFISPHLIPKIALCDPLLTISLPPRLTAATGMDALTHCIETFLSPRVNPPADAIALDGAQRAAKWIEIASTFKNDFKKEQHDYIQKKYYDVAIANLQRQGLDMTKYGPAVQDLIWSGAVQFGPANTRAFTEALRDKSTLTDKDIVTLVSEWKINNVNTLFKSSSESIRAGVKSRYQSEKTALLNLIK